MKLIRSKFPRLFGQKYICMPWAIYAAPMAIIREGDIDHELIHIAQWRELLYIGFILWYFLEWLARLAQYRNFSKAYRNISFEREAYANDKNPNYLSTRKRYSFKKYIKNVAI